MEKTPYNCDDPTIATEDGIYIAQTTYDGLSYTQQHNVDEDTEFIAHAKEDVGYLLNLIKL